MEREEYIAKLRGLADVLEMHPDCPLPYEGTSSHLTIYVHDREHLAAAVRALGSGRKEDGGNTLDFTPTEFDDFLTVRAFKEGTCRRIVKGTRVVPKQVVPRRVIPEHEEEIVEWECAPVLDPEPVAS